MRNLQAICLQLTSVTALSLNEIESETLEIRVIDLWNSHLESLGVEVRTPKEKAMDEGFTAQDMEKARNLVLIRQENNGNK